MSHFVTLHQILKVFASKRKFLRSYNNRRLIEKVLLTLGLHAISLNFVKFMGNCFKVCAAYKRDSVAILYQIAGIRLLVSTTINIWYISIVYALVISKT